MFSEIALKKLDLYINELVSKHEFDFSDPCKLYRFLHSSLLNIIERDAIIETVGKQSKQIRMLAVWTFIRLYRGSTDLYSPTYEEYSSNEVFTPCYYALGDTEMTSTHNEYLAVESLFWAKSAQSVLDLITKRDLWSYQYVNLKRIQDYIRLEYKSASKYHRKRLAEANRIAVEEGDSADLKTLLDLMGIDMDVTGLPWHDCSTKVVVHAIREHAKSRKNIVVFRVI